MTILGQHTIAETRDLIRAIDFQVNQYEKKFNDVQVHRPNVTTHEQDKLNGDWVDFIKAWTETRDKQSLAMLGGMLANPSAHPSIIPAESNFQAITNVVQARIPHWADIKQRIDAEAQMLALPPVDLSAQPAQNSPDADSVAIRKLDAAIAAAGNPLGKPGGSDSVLKSPLGIALIVGSVVAAGAGALYVKKVVF